MDSNSHSRSPAKLLHLNIKNWLKAVQIMSGWLFRCVLHPLCALLEGGQSSEGAAQVHFSSELVRSSHSSTSETLSAWKERYKTPTLWCTLTSLSGHLLAIGGQDEHKNCSNAMFMYDTKFDIWIKAGSMRHKRSACLAAVPSGASSSVMVVVGGFIRPNEVTNAAEVIVSNL